MNKFIEGDQIIHINTEEDIIADMIAGKIGGNHILYEATIVKYFNIGSVEGVKLKDITYIRYYDDKIHYIKTKYTQIGVSMLDYFKLNKILTIIYPDD